MRQTFLGALALAVMLAPGILRAQSSTETAALKKAETFTDQVVRVLPQRTDGSKAMTGFGLLIGEKNGRVFVATPYHVAVGTDRPSSLTDTPRVVFRDDRYNPVSATRLSVASPNDDLAVLEVTPPVGRALPHATAIDANRLDRGTWAWNIGIGQDWDMPDRAGGIGLVDTQTRLRRVGQLRTPPGASGGAVVTEDGIIGMVLQDGDTYSWVLPIERIIELFKAWDLPTDLLSANAPPPPRIYNAPAQIASSVQKPPVAVPVEPPPVGGGSRAVWRQKYMRPVRADTRNVFVASFADDIDMARSRLQQFCDDFPNMDFDLWETVADDRNSNRRYAIVAGYGLDIATAAWVVGEAKRLGIAHDAYSVVQPWDVDNPDTPDSCPR